MAESPNQKMLLLPIEATGILGSLAGIAELAKESFAQQAEQRSAARPAMPPRFGRIGLGAMNFIRRITCGGCWRCC